MNILLINEVCGHTSTGKICAGIAEKYEAEGHTVKIAYGRESYVPEEYQRFAVRIGSDFDVKISAIQTRIFDNNGLANRNPTRKFIKWAKKFNPDLVWLHNIHGYYINYEILFEWIKSRPQMQVKWTLHDCWAITGHCCYFTAIKCDKWKKGCMKCPQINRYPKSLFIDGASNNYKRKKQAFMNVNKMQIITPSEWLADIVKESFLKDYPVEVIYNSINAEIFKPRKSNFREKYGLQGKKVLLGVANVWEERKGLNIFYQLAKRLSNEYVIVLVGLNNRQMKEKPDCIIGIKRTNNQEELAEIYTAADLFINPSVEETFGMTSMEAKLCGTESIVYAGTACEEIANKYGGIVVPMNDLEALINAIIQCI